MKPFNTLTLCPLLECNLVCKYCIMKCSYKYHKSYIMSLDNVDSVIKFTKLSGYIFHTINISGGEPLLWKNLLIAVKKLKKAEIAKNIVLSTNAWLITPDNIEWIHQIIKYIDKVHISNYGININNIKFAKESFPGKCIIHKKIEHIPLSSKCHNDALPAKCLCNTYFVVGNQVHICTGAFYMPYILNKKPDQYTQLQVDYLKPFEQIDVLNMDICKYCLSNKKIRIKNLKKHIVEPKEL